MDWTVRMEELVLLFPILATDAPTSAKAEGMAEGLSWEGPIGSCSVTSGPGNGEKRAGFMCGTEAGNPGFA